MSTFNQTQKQSDILCHTTTVHVCVMSSLIVEEGVLGVLLLLLHPEVVSSTEEDNDEEDNAKDLAARHLGLAGLELGLELLNLFASALVNGVTTVGNILDETLADLLDLELTILIVRGALGGLLVKSKAVAVGDLLASELVVGG